MTNKDQKALQVLEDLEEYVSHAKCELFSSTRIVVDRIQVQEYLHLLRQYLQDKED